MAEGQSEAKRECHGGAGCSLLGGQGRVICLFKLEIEVLVPSDSLKPEHML